VSDISLMPWACPSICLLVWLPLSVSLSVCRQNEKNTIISKTEQFRAMVIDDL